MQTLSIASLAFLCTNPAESEVLRNNRQTPINQGGSVHGESVVNTIFEKYRSPSSTHKHVPLASWNGDNGYLPWSDAQVPYVLDDAFPAFMKDRIRLAMDALSRRTCMTFIDIEKAKPSTNSTVTNRHIQTYMHALRESQIDAPGGSGTVSDPFAVENLPANFLAILFYPRLDFLCAALGIGMHPKKDASTEVDPNIMFLSRGCDAATIVHELLHVMGFDHEMTRNDRDSFIDVRTISDPAFERERFQFEKRENSRDLFGYDYQSIMHYGDNAVRYRGIPILNAPVEIIDFSYLRATDQAAVNFVYGCTRHKKLMSKKLTWVHEKDAPLRCVSSVSSPKAAHKEEAETPRVYLRPGVPFHLQFTAMKNQATPREDFTFKVVHPYVEGAEKTLDDIIDVAVHTETREQTTFGKIYAYIFGGTSAAQFVGSSVSMDLLVRTQSPLNRWMNGSVQYPDDEITLVVVFTLKSTGEEVRSEVILEIIDDTAGAEPICFGSRGRDGCSGNGVCEVASLNTRGFGRCVCDKGWKGERCQIRTDTMCTGSYSLRLNSQMDTAVLFPAIAANATALYSEDDMARKAYIDSLQFVDTIASPYSRSTLDGQRGGLRVDTNLKLHMRSLVQKREPDAARITPGRITLSMILPLGLSRTEIQLYSSAKPAERYRIPISQGAIATRSLPFSDFQEFLPEPNAYTFFDITPNYDRGDIGVRINGDAMWMTIFGHSNDHFHPDAARAYDQADGPVLDEIDTIEIVHEASDESGPCFVEEVTMECRVAVQPKVSYKREVVVHDEEQSFLLVPPAPEQSAFMKNAEVIGSIAEQYADSILSLERGQFFISTLRKGQGPQLLVNRRPSLIYAVSSSVIDATILGAKTGPKRDVNAIMVYLNSNILQRHNLAAPMVFANRFSEHRGHGSSFDMSTESRSCFLADVQKGTVRREAIKGPSGIRHALRLNSGDEKFVETLPTPIHFANSLTFSFRIPRLGGGTSRPIYVSEHQALVAHNLFMFTVTQYGRATDMNTFELRVGLTSSRNMQAVYASPGFVEPYASYFAGLLLTYENQPAEHIKDNEWYTVVVEAGALPSDEATVAVYRTADKKLIMHMPIKYATREIGFLSNIRSFQVKSPSVPLEISEIHFTHASRPDRIQHTVGAKNAPESEIEVVVQRSKIYKDSIREVSAIGAHPFDIRAGPHMFVRVQPNGAVEHAVPKLEGVFAHIAKFPKAKPRNVAGHTVHPRHRAPDMLCYVDPSIESRPFAISGSLVCRNSTRLLPWLGKDEHKDKGQRAAVKEILAFLNAQPTTAPMQVATYLSERVQRLSEAEAHDDSDLHALLHLQSGVRDLTAQRVVRRAKALADVRRALTDAHPEWQRYAQWRLEKREGSLWKSFLSLFYGKGPSLLSEHAALRAAQKRALPALAIEAIFTSRWWDAVDDLSFIASEVLPVVERAMQKASEFHVDESEDGSYTQLKHAFARLQAVVEKEQSRLHQAKLFKTKKGKHGLTEEQEALLVEHNQFLENIQQHSSGNAMLLDVRASFSDDPRDELAAHLGRAKRKRVLPVSAPDLKRRPEFLVAALEALCEWNRIAFENWDAWIAETLKVERQMWRW